MIFTNGLTGTPRLRLRGILRLKSGIERKKLWLDNFPAKQYKRMCAEIGRNEWNHHTVMYSRWPPRLWKRRGAKTVQVLKCVCLTEKNHTRRGGRNKVREKFREANVIASRSGWKRHLRIAYLYALRPSKTCAEQWMAMGTAKRGSGSAVVDRGCVWEGKVMEGKRWICCGEEKTEKKRKEGKQRYSEIGENNGKCWIDMINVRKYGRESPIPHPAWGPLCRFRAIKKPIGSKKKLWTFRVDALYVSEICFLWSMFE